MPEAFNFKALHVRAFFVKTSIRSGLMEDFARRYPPKVGFKWLLGAFLTLRTALPGAVTALFLILYLLS